MQVKMILMYYSYLEIDLNSRVVANVDGGTENHMPILYLLA